MRIQNFVCSLLLICLSWSAAQSQTQPASPLPHLEKRGPVTQLIVDGKPYLALAGELGNNTATSLDNMQTVWPKLTSMHLNTVLAAISWALLEPQEGKFDFTLVDGLIAGARQHDLRLVLLWFGSWKNTYSSYVPDWVKRDFQRFPRVQRSDGSGTERLSPFNTSNRDADAKAFAALMRHIREVDSGHTVIMVQVENEVGVIPEARDHSSAANAAYNAPVPAELMQYLEKHKEDLVPELRAKWQAAGFKKSGTWEEVFGPGLETQDFFMAWYFAKYIGAVTTAGKAEYPLPMFVNAALIRPSYAPGQYNSGGPLPHSLDIWRAGAPDLDFLAPDIYFNFKEWTAKFVQSGNPLFIPEARGGGEGAKDAFYAIGHHSAFGFSPFAVENGAGAENPLAASYNVLSQLSPLILKQQTSGNVEGVVLEELTPSQRISVGDFTLTVTPIASRPGVPVTQSAGNPFGIFIASGPDEYFIAASGLSVTFAPNTPGPPIAGLATVEQGNFVEGQWQRGLTLAGDATAQGNELRFPPGPPHIDRVTLYRYK